MFCKLLNIALAQKRIVHTTCQAMLTMLWWCHWSLACNSSCELCECLQVAICGAAPGMVHSVRLHSDCSSSELQVSPRGEVFSSDRHSFSKFTLSFYLSPARPHSLTQCVNKKHREHAHFTSQSLGWDLWAQSVVCVSRVMNAPLSLFPARITLFQSRALQVSPKIVFLFLLLLGKCDFFLFHWEMSIKILMANRAVVILSAF